MYVNLAITVTQQWGIDPNGVGPLVWYRTHMCSEFDKSANAN